VKAYVISDSCHARRFIGQLRHFLCTFEAGISFSQIIHEVTMKTKIILLVLAIIAFISIAGL